MTMHDVSPRQRGFTLLEVLLAVSITAVVMVTVGTTFHVLLNARDVVDELAESTEAGPRMLNLIERDLRGLWTFNVHNNAVFRGRDMDVNGRDADRIDFLTTTDAVGFVLDLQNQPRKPTVNEVGYWFKPNRRYRDVFEMWRREDPMLDDDITTQGTFQLVYDRVKSFKVTYFRTLGHETQEENQWDSAAEDSLPKRIKIEFTIERRRSSRNVVSDVEIDDFEGAEKTYVRHFVFDQRYDGILAAQSARMPVLPPEPVEQAGGPEGGGGGGGGGGARGAVEQSFGSGRGDGGGKGETVSRGGSTVQTSGGGRGTTTMGPGGGGGNRAGQGPSFPPGFDPSQFLNGLGFGGGGNGGNLFGGGG